MLNPWKITWWDNFMLRETVIPPTDPWNVIHSAQGHGVNCSSIIKMERIGQ